MLTKYSYYFKLVFCFKRKKIIKYNPNEAPNRYVKRQIDAENKKARKVEK